MNSGIVSKHSLQVTSKKTICGSLSGKQMHVSSVFFLDTTVLREMVQTIWLIHRALIPQK